MCSTTWLAAVQTCTPPLAVCQWWQTWRQTKQTLRDGPGWSGEPTWPMPATISSFYSPIDTDMSHVFMRCDSTFSYSLKHTTFFFFFFYKKGSSVSNMSDVSEQYYSARSQKSTDLMASSVFFRRWLSGLMSLTVMRCDYRSPFPAC